MAEAKNPWAVDIHEYERGWGNRIDETKTFPTYEEAESFAKEFNSRNTEEVVPDWYMVASEPYRIS